MIVMPAPATDTLKVTPQQTSVVSTMKHKHAEDFDYLDRSPTSTVHAGRNSGRLKMAKAEDIASRVSVTQSSQRSAATNLG